MARISQKKSRNVIVGVAFLFFTAGMHNVAFAATDADNSKVNADQQAHSEMNAQDQGNSKEDIAVTREIRQAVVKTPAFSTDAKNVKIITKNGMVTLKGPVKSMDEKDQIVKIAKRIAGDTKVVNQIEIAK